MIKNGRLLVILDYTCELLGLAVARCLPGVEVSADPIRYFNDGEVSISLQRDLSGYVVFMVRALLPHSGQKFHDALLLASHLKKLGAASIVLFAPYLPYARQHSSSEQPDNILNLSMELMGFAGIDKVIAPDIHSGAGFSECGHNDWFTVNYINDGFEKSDEKTVYQEKKTTIRSISFVPMWASYLKTYISRSQENILVVAPDEGASSNVRRIADLLGVQHLILNKKRFGPVVKYDEVLRNLTDIIANKKCILVDDIVDSGETLCQAGEVLRANGAAEIEALVTHPVLSNHDSISKIAKSYISKVTVTDSIRHVELPEKFVIIELAEMFKSDEQL